MNRLLSVFQTYSKKNTHIIILAFFITTYIAYFTAASFLRFDNFYAGRFDLGNMDQAVWNTTQGRIFQTSIEIGDEDKIASRLSAHADFILVLLAPFYFIWNSPKMLLLIQTIVLAAGALFIYLISLRILKNKNISVTLAIAYLLNPSLQYTNLYDFHAVTLATTFLLGAFYAILVKKYGMFIVFAILSGITKEQVWMTVALLGGYLIVCTSPIKKITLTHLLGLFVVIFSLSSFYYLIWHAIPNARGENHFALEYYSEFGDSPSSIAKAIITSPVKTIRTALQPEQREYLNKLLTPTGYISIFSPLFIIFSGADLIINLLSSNKNLHQIYYQYTAVITPFTFIATVYSINMLKRRFPFVSYRIFMLYLLIFALYSAYSFGPLPKAKRPSTDMFTHQRSEKQYINVSLQKIPPSSTVAATNNIGSHLSRREKIFTIPNGVYETEYVVFLLGDLFAQPSPQVQEEMIKRLKTDVNYKIIAQKNDFIIFKKKM